jgi:hypothetical protein
MNGVADMKRMETIFIDKQVVVGIGADSSWIGGKYENTDNRKRKRTYSDYP